MADLAKKLQLKINQSLAVINPPKNYLANLKSELSDILFVPSRKIASATLICVKNVEEVCNLVTPAIKAANAEALFWVAYPKGTSGIKTDVNRDRLWEALDSTGWRPVRLIALDEIWSVMRFRPEGKVSQNDRISSI